MIGTRFSRLLLILLMVGGPAGPAWAGVVLTLEGADANDYNGTCVDISGNTILVGGQMGGAGGKGWAQAFVYSGGEWLYQATLTSADPALTSTSRFGFGLGLDGDTAVIGAYGANKVYSFNRAAGAWSEDTGSRLTYPGANRFGFDTRIDGSRAIVGAYGSDSAYVFTKATTWDAGVPLPAYDTTGDFGYRVDLSGTRAIVGNPPANKAYCYRLEGSTWITEATFSHGGGSDRFGFAVAIDGDYAIVGADQSDAGVLSDTGSATIYHREGTGWVEQAFLAPAGLAAGDQFGTSVAISGDRAVVGAINQGPLGGRAGSVFVFQRIGTAWYQAGDPLRPTGGAVGDQFGHAVAIDGNWIAVGAWMANTYAGTAYAFETPSLTYIPGDANFDGKVDQYDATTLAAHWGQSGGWTDGNFDGDGLVGPADASIMAANWHYGVTEGSSSSSVPEPSQVVLLVGARLFMLAARRRR